eukprot:657087-Rhodomonas_salina.1
MSGTDLADGTTPLRACYAMSGHLLTWTSWYSTGLHPCYGMSGTDTAYGAIGLCTSYGTSVLTYLMVLSVYAPPTQCLVPTWHTTLPPYAGTNLALAGTRLLALYPEEKKKLFAELDHVLNGRPPTFEDLPKLEQVRLILTETLRLFPQPPVLIRRVPRPPFVLARAYCDRKCLAILRRSALLAYAIILRTRYAMSGTEIGYGGTRLWRVTRGLRQPA